MGGIRRFFKLDDLGTNIRTEVRAGIVTFIAMSYIIFVNPIILQNGWRDKPYAARAETVAPAEEGAEAAPAQTEEQKAEVARKKARWFNSVMMATCISAGIATIVMGLLANYPIALAPAMGHNVFFAFIVCGSMGVPWPRALGAVCISGCLFILLSFFGLRERVMTAIPECLKSAIAVGIGLLIALIGFEHAGLVEDDPETLVRLARNLASKPVVLSLVGLGVLSILMVWRMRGAVLISIVFCLELGMLMGMFELPVGPEGAGVLAGLVSRPPSMAPTFFKLDLSGMFSLDLLLVIFVFFFLDLFDTVGTLIGVSEQAGFMKEGKLPRARQALLSDAIGTVGGAVLGTSTVTSYIESSAGVSDGGRSGLANIVTGLLFLVAIFFSPVVALIGGGCRIEGNPLQLYPVTAPVLIVVGCLMMSNVTRIDWKDLTDAIPAFLTLIVMPLTFSITDGIAIGFISYALLKLVRGQSKQVSAVVYIFSVLFLFQYVARMALMRT